MSRMNPESPAAPPSPRRFRRDRILAGIIVLAAIGGYALLMATRAPPTPVQPAEQAWRVTVEPLRYGEFAPSLLVYGQLESPAAADLSANISADVETVTVLEGDSVRSSVRRVHAPFAGRVTRVAVAAGDRVQTGQLLVSLYDPSRLELRAPLPQPLLPRIQAALAAQGTLAASAGQDGASVSGQLVRLSASARSGSGNVDGFFRFAQGHPDWEPGRSLAITLTLPPVPEVAAIPYEALYGRNRIYFVEGGRMKGVTVETVGEYREPGGRPRLLVRGPGLTGELPLIITQVPRAVDGLKVTTADPDG
jgi:multidrug efflux pump subunit AcrA (membrane-fusion protein)